MLPPPLPPDLFDALPPAVQAYIRYLEARLADLEAKLNQTSANSSKPPSSDGPHVKPAPPKTPSGKRRGGQPGHPKHERVILPPDQVIDHKPTRCHRCAAALTGDDPHPTVDQVFDLPVQLRHVTHHRRHTLACPCCHAQTTAAPVPAAASGFGPRLTPRGHRTTAGRGVRGPRGARSEPLRGRRVRDVLPGLPARRVIRFLPRRSLPPVVGGIFPGLTRGNAQRRSPTTRSDADPDQGRPSVRSPDRPCQRPSGIAGRASGQSLYRPRTAGTLPGAVTAFA